MNFGFFPYFHLEHRCMYEKQPFSDFFEYISYKRMQKRRVLNNFYLPHDKFQVAHKVSKCHIIHHFQFLLRCWSISLLPFLGRKAKEVCNTEKEHFKTNQKVLCLLSPHILVIFCVCVPSDARSICKKSNYQTLPKCHELGKKRFDS